MLRVALIGALIATASSHALADRSEPPFTSIRGPRAAPRVASQAPTTAARDAFDTLAAQGWRAQWDRDTGVPTWLWGGSVTAPRAVADAAVAERAARAFLVEHLALLAPGSRADDLELVANQRDGELRTVAFRQRHGDLPVLGGQLGFVFAHDRLFAIASHALPDVTATMSPPARDVSRAAAWVTAGTRRRATVHGVTGRAILPTVRGPGDIAYDTVDIVDVRADHGAWDVYVASDGTPLARRSRIFDATGTLVYNAGERYATGTRADYIAPRVPITVDGSATTTDDAGAFAWSGTANATVVPGLANDRVVIVNHAGPLATASLDAQDGQHVSWNAATDEQIDAQISTFIYGNLVKERDRRINPGAAAWIDQPLAFHVNEGGSCNAFSTGDEVHFFGASSFCQNTGRIADIVFHEFGHSFHNHSLIPGMGMMEPALAEGLADFNAALVTEDSGVGRGFNYTNDPTREIDPVGFEKQWPGDIDQDPHITGEIVSGALWDLRKALIADLGHDAGTAAVETIFTGVMQRASDIPSSYMAALVADDDNGDLADGTPHHCAIDHAFALHGLASAPLTTIAPPVVDGISIAVNVTAPTAGPCSAPTVAKMTVTWQVHGGAPSTFDLAPAGDVWRGSFPAQPDGTLLEYKVEAQLTDGSSRVFPDNRADPLYQLYVGPVTPIYGAHFEEDEHWEQMGNHGNQWTVGAPQGLGGDPAIAFAGSSILGTDLNGDGLYPALENDEITVPAVDVSGFTRVRLQYRRWLTVEDATYDRATITVNGQEAWSNATGTGTLDHVDKEWRFHDIDITPFVTGGSAQLQFKLQSDSGRQLGGWNIDELCLVGVGKLPDPGPDGCPSCELTAGGGGGCCSADSHPTSALVLGAGVLGLALRRRRR